MDDVRAGQFPLVWLRHTFAAWWIMLQPDARRCHECKGGCTRVDHLAHPTTLGTADWKALWVGGLQGLLQVMVYLAACANAEDCSKWQVPEEEWFMWMYDVCWTFGEMRAW